MSKREIMMYRFLWLVLMHALFMVGNVYAALPDVYNIADVKLPAPSAKPDVSPRMLSSQLKDSLTEVRPSCVGVFSSGEASGVIISPDGLIISAAHILRSFKVDQVLKITLADEHEVDAKLLGFNRETDYALLQITTPSETPWPHCALAKTAPTTGNFCFTVAHPSGYLKDRPAQVRLGRIFSHSMRDDKPFFLFADCNIQPGDSGGPVFSMDGKLIAMASSAANVMGFNILPAIDQYHLDKKRLLNSERWGDIENAPDRKAFVDVDINDAVQVAVKKEFRRRVADQYPPTMDFIQTLVNTNGEVALTFQAIIDHMPRETIAIAKNQPVGFGLDDNLLNQKLLPLPPDSPHAPSLYDGDQHIGYALIFDSSNLVTKLSLLTNNSNLSIRNGGRRIKLKQVASDAEWDLALLRVTEDHRIVASKWIPANRPVQAGDLLKAKTRSGNLVWNVATDKARAVTKKRSIGPLMDKSIISTHRSPYPLAIRHALPLYAKEAGIPIFNQDGQIVGMHIARFSRTMGLMIPIKELIERTKIMVCYITNSKFGCLSACITQAGG